MPGKQNEPGGQGAKPVDIKVITAANGFTATLEVRDPKEHQQRSWVSGSFYEAHKTGLLSYLYRNNYFKMKCLDIGASIGNHTVYFSKVLRCDVVSVEPVKESFDHLARNCALNGMNARLFNVALGDHAGEVSMRNVSRSHYNVGMYQVVKGAGTEMTTLDLLVPGEQFDFIKIDVEHYNEPLLAGAKEVLSSQKKCDAFIECETKSILETTDQMMANYGYKRNKSLVLNHTPTYLWSRR